MDGEKKEKVVGKCYLHFVNFVINVLGKGISPQTFNCMKSLYDILRYGEKGA